MSTEETTEELHGPMIEFIEDALGFPLKPWQREMARRFYLDQIAPERAAQAEEAAYIDEMDERQDVWDGQGRTSRRGGGYQFGDFARSLMEKTGPIVRDEQPGPPRFYRRTRAQDRTIAEIEKGMEITVTRYPDQPLQKHDREWLLEAPNGERIHFGRGRITAITTEQDQA